MATNNAASTITRATTTTTPVVVDDVKKTISNEDDDKLTMSLVKKKLITKEDPMHVHKILGTIALSSFIWRFGYLFIYMGDPNLGFTTYPKLTIPTIVMHVLLNVTSLIFNIPKRRIKNGYRIWPEYRLHSLVFTIRGLSILTVKFLFERELPIGQYNIKFAGYMIVMITMAMADLSTWSVGKYASKFSRDMEASPYIKFFASAIQIMATSITIMDARSYVLPYYGVLVLQGNAFLMTLHRKNIFGHRGLLKVYGSSLAFGVYVGTQTNKMPLHILLVALTIALYGIPLRIGPRHYPLLKPIQDNKYLLWTIATIVRNHFLPTPDASQLTMEKKITLGVAMLFGLIWTGIAFYHKVMVPLQKNKDPLSKPVIQKTDPIKKKNE